jgi:transcription elongation factor Elf1
MTTRNIEGYQKYIHDFIKEVYVVCPSCNKQAQVKSSGESFKGNNKSEIRLICTNCGHSKTSKDYSRNVLYSSSADAAFGGYILIGSPLDPFFHLPLWLTTTCCDNLLWAYNYEHLHFLEKHVEAKLRERNGVEVSNRSLGSQLPRWMTSSKNRKEVLKCIENLKTKK